jgi:hypothetical protein
MLQNKYSNEMVFMFDIRRGRKGGGGRRRIERRHLMCCVGWKKTSASEKVGN